MTPFATMKQRILKLTGNSWINLQVAKDKAKIKLIATEDDCKAVLAVLEKPRRIAPPVPQWVKDRYNEAHRLYATRETPGVVRDGHYCEPLFPEVHKANGLQKFIVNYATWLGYYGNRINTMGRKLPNGKWIKSSTKKGTGDVVLAMPGGKMLWAEVKVGSDTPSEKQLAQQRKIKAAGADYIFVRTAQQFIEIFDSYLYGS